MVRPVTYRDICGPDTFTKLCLHTPGGLMLELDPSVFPKLDPTLPARDMARTVANWTGCRVTVEELVQTSVSPDYTD